MKKDFTKKERKMKDNILIALYTILAVCIGAFNSYATYYRGSVDLYIKIATAILVILPLFKKQRKD